MSKHEDDLDVSDITDTQTLVNRVRNHPQTEGSCITFGYMGCKTREDMIERSNALTKLFPKWRQQMCFNTGWVFFDPPEFRARYPGYPNHH